MSRTAPRHERRATGGKSGHHVIGLCSARDNLADGFDLDVHHLWETDRQTSDVTGHG